MRKLLLAATAMTLVAASPATARDGQGYVGIEGGLLFGAKADLDLTAYNEPFIGTVETGDGDLDLDLDTGHDVDLIGGYDFGMIRAELELAHKKASLDSFDLETTFSDPIIPDGTYDDLDGSMRIWSLMLNALFDFGNEDGLSFYVGPGFGRAWTKLNSRDFDDLSFTRKDNVWAWQLIAGARYAVTPNIDIGLKYRYFRTGKIRYDDVFNTEGVTFTDISCQSPIPGLTAAAVPAQVACGYWADGRGHFRSHSLMASLVYNFGEPALPPPPPPPPPAPPDPAPATQTCYDGSVILATDTCPAPPPPPPAPERG